MKPGPKPGYRQTPEHRAAISAALPRGEAHHLFKGDAAHPKTGRSRAERLYPSAGPCSECGAAKAERHHKDGDTLNNAPGNIEILCRRCHMARDGRLGRMRQVRAAARQSGGRPKFGTEQVREMFRLRDQGMSQSQIGIRFGVGQTVVGRILGGKRRRYQEMMGETT